MKHAILWDLFAVWFRIGLFTFGGGYAMLPLIEREVIEKKGWTDKDEILDIYALAQSVPGVIAINTAIFLGNQLAGPLGALVAAAGVIAPSIVVIVTIALSFHQLQSMPYVMQAFAGIRAAVVGLVGAAAIRIAMASCQRSLAIGIAIVAFLLSLFTVIHAAWIIVAAGLIGFLISDEQ